MHVATLPQSKPFDNRPLLSTTVPFFHLLFGNVSCSSPEHKHDSGCTPNVLHRPHTQHTSHNHNIDDLPRSDDTSSGRTSQINATIIFTANLQKKLEHCEEESVQPPRHNLFHGIRAYIQSRCASTRIGRVTNPRIAFRSMWCRNVNHVPKNQMITQPVTCPLATHTRLW